VLQQADRLPLVMRDGRVVKGAKKHMQNIRST